MLIEYFKKDTTCELNDKNKVFSPFTLYGGKGGRDFPLKIGFKFQHILKVTKTFSRNNAELTFVSSISLKLRKPSVLVKSVIDRTAA